MLQKHKHKRIQNRFILFFIVVSLPPLIFLGLVASWSVTKTRAVNVAELETQVIAGIANRIEKFILDRVEGIEFRIADRTITSLTQVPEEGKEFFLEQLLGSKEFRGLQRVAMVDTRGQEMKTIYRDHRPTTLADVASSDAFTVASRGERYFSPVRVEAGVPVMTLAASVLNSDGFLVGVITAEMDLSFIQNEILRDVTLGARGYVYVVNQEQKIIGYSGGNERVGQIVSLPIVASVLSGNTHNGLAKDDRYAGIVSEFVFAAARPITGMHLGVIVEWPEHDALLVVRTIQRQIAVFALSTLLIILLASLLLSRQITKPITVLKTGAAIIGGGKFEHRITLARHDELGELAESFNEMGTHLKELDELKTIRIRSEALAESLKKEQELSRQKDVFISVMSHQLRTPLTAMQWDMEYLFGEVAKPELATYADSIKDAAQSSQQITAIVDDLLTVSELGIGYTVKKTEALDVTALLKEIQSGLDRRIQEKKLTFTLQLPETPLMIDANPHDLRKVFLNLFDNAITYTKEGGMVTVTGKDDGDGVICTITDTGIGVPASEQKDLFREFFRATNAIVGKNVGTGLGLFIVKTIVQGHGGTVVCVSEENKGTTCTVRLPKKQKIMDRQT